MSAFPQGKHDSQKCSDFDSDDTTVREIPKSEANLPSDGKVGFFSKPGKLIGEVPRPLIIAVPSCHVTGPYGLLQTTTQLASARDGVCEVRK